MRTGNHRALRWYRGAVSPGGSAERPTARRPRFPVRSPLTWAAGDFLFIQCTWVQKAIRLAKEEGIVVDGHVTEVLPDRKYRVELENGHTVLAYGAGKMTKFKIRVMVGDRVTLSLSPYDLTRGRITYRHKT